MTARATPVVLVADDEPSMLALVARHIKTLGYQVIEASDGEAAWQEASRVLPDLVVLDVMMPGMSGWEVCRRVRESVGLAHTGVIMLTGIGQSLNELTSPLYGADAYLDKPFEFGDLDEKITNVLKSRGHTPIEVDVPPVSIDGADDDDDDDGVVDDSEDDESEDDDDDVVDDSEDDESDDDKSDDDKSDDDKSDDDKSDDDEADDDESDDDDSDDEKSDGSESNVEKAFDETEAPTGTPRGRGKRTEREPLPSDGYLGASEGSEEADDQFSKAMTLRPPPAVAKKKPAAKKAAPKKVAAKAVPPGLHRGQSSRRQSAPSRRLRPIGY